MPSWRLPRGKADFIDLPIEVLHGVVQGKSFVGLNVLQKVEGVDKEPKRDVSHPVLSRKVSFHHSVRVSGVPASWHSAVVVVNPAQDFPMDGHLAG